MLRAAGLALMLVLAVAAPASAAPTLRSLGTFSLPTWAGAPASEPSRVFVTQRQGLMRVIVDGAVQATPFLDLTGVAESGDNERGLLSAAFASDYATSGLFYVYLTAKSPLGAIQIWEYRRSADPERRRRDERTAAADDPARAGRQPQRRPGPRRAGRLAVAGDR